MLSSKLTSCGRTVMLMAGIAGASKLSRQCSMRFFRWYGNGARRFTMGLSLPVLLATSADKRGQFMANPISDAQTLGDGQDMKVRMELFILRIQKEVCEALEAEETCGAKFEVDRWSRIKEKEGGGITCVLEGGEVLERAAVNISVIRSPLMAKQQESMLARFKTLPAGHNYEFFAAGVSSVIHPTNPHVPTMHFNFRYFEIQDENGENKHHWFGGGADLTPYYLEQEDVVLFHSALKTACDKHGTQRYPQYKKTCDNYFFNRARGECRGVGGIFFDHLQSKDASKEFNFVKDCGDAIIPSYIPIVRRRKHDDYTAAQRDWQLHRRGRYVEFNLVYDRGTKFGFETPNARIESILVSLPSIAKWSYKHTAEPGSPEHTLTEVLKNPKDWI